MYKIYSIGPGNESVENFIIRLKKWGITNLIDLRSEPYSQYVPQFNRDRLTATLRSEGISYVYFGDKLGGRPPEGFEQFHASSRYTENINLLLDQIKDKTIALMCSEFDISKCHRRFIVGDITKTGIEVMVIDKEGNASKYQPQTTNRKHHNVEENPKSQSRLTSFG